MQEIMNVPDNIPQDVMEKAECVIVFPSVLKAAFVVGASYGRGAMVCRTGERFRGPWGSPAMMYALEGGSIGFQIAPIRPQHLFCFRSLDMPGRAQNSPSQLLSHERGK